jgi:hypothetical protein
VSLLSRCVGSDGLGSGDHVLMLTGERMVVTRQSRLLGRVRLCLDAPVAAIENLRWSADPAGPGVELNFTVLEGPGASEPRRWHFWLPAAHAKRVWRIDALLACAFRRPKADARPADEAGRPAFAIEPSLAEETVRLMRPVPVTNALDAVVPAGALPASPLPAPNVGPPAPRTERPSAGVYLTADDRPVEALPDAGSAINANRSPRVPPQPNDFRPTGFETSFAAV